MHKSKWGSPDCAGLQLMASNLELEIPSPKLTMSYTVVRGCVNTMSCTVVTGRRGGNATHDDISQANSVRR